MKHEKTEPLYELDGLINKLLVYEDRVIIENPSGQKEDQTLNLSDIMAVHYRKAGLLKGSIEISPQRDWVLRQDNDTLYREENCVDFQHAQNDDAEKIYLYLAGALRRIEKTPGYIM